MRPVKRLLAVFVTALMALLGLVAVPSGGATAVAESNGVGLKPAMGWSSWSKLRHDPTLANVEAQAKAMVTSGLKKVGYTYINLDDFWYTCPGSQGPDVDSYGRWAINTTSFPNQGSLNGIEALADYVHSLGLKFGIYVTPGISKQAVAENTPIEGTDYTADDIATTTPENNYNCGGMVGIDYSKPGAQAFINSWADEFASWGVDYVKMDGVGSFDIPDVQAWSTALQQTGRPIHLELSNSLNINDASTWQQYSNGWRTGGDIECYCGSTSYPLTDWSNVESRFDQVAEWAPYGGPGAYNDYDSIEVGNGNNDGLTPVQRQTQLSLWSLASSPLLLGTDLTHLTKLDLSYLLNKSVIAVDQDGIDAHRVSDTSTSQVFAKTEKNGDVVVGLFNTGSSPEAVSTSAASLGLKGSAFKLDNLWTNKSLAAGHNIVAEVPSDGVALFKVTPLHSGAGLPPDVVVSTTGSTTFVGRQLGNETVALTNDGPSALSNVKLSLSLPAAWKAQAALHLAKVASGRTVTASFGVRPPTQSGALAYTPLRGRATWKGGGASSLATTLTTLAGSVHKPYLSYSSATDAPTTYAQKGSDFVIMGGGSDLYSDADNYTTIYKSQVVQSDSSVQTEVTTQQGMTGYAKAGIIVRNSMTGSGTTPEGAILYESPGGGIQLEWSSTGGDYLDSVTPSNGGIPDTVPVYLRLVRSGATYTGYYSTNGTTWTEVGTATLSNQATTQDAGMFVLSHDSGVDGLAEFNGFSVVNG